MSDPETELQILESAFPSLSGEAFSAAHAEALAAGLSVMQAEDGVIYEVFPDGQRREVMKVEAPVPVLRGSKIRLD
jgi:hypothetical protein